MVVSWLDRPDKTEEAKSTFEEIPDCVYASKLLGSLGQLEFMACDCGEHWLAKLNKNMACGELLDCINRVTLVECVNGKLGCGDNCRNQRFQNHQYAPIQVFDTDNKGYGVRAKESLKKGTFIYEYIGEVIGEEDFRKRMVEYDQANMKHFYFMMLTLTAFIDATRKGALSRFCNHSCNPNAYVDKWVVGRKLRMGIFAKRDIEKGEEITFDYNVDRYGAQSQPCYCGEANCIGFMGGKTQTDAALLLPDGIAEALGVTSKQERQWLRENKHLRKEQQWDDDTVNRHFIEQVEVKPLENDFEVLKVMSALMKTTEEPLARKLIQRIYITEDSDLQMAVMRFHGYKTFLSILKQFADDQNLVHMVLSILLKWPRVTKNKISSSQIEDVVLKFADTTSDADIQTTAKELLTEWSKLQMAYRIPKSKAGSLVSFFDRNTRLPLEDVAENLLAREALDPPANANEPEVALPENWAVAIDPNSDKRYYYNRITKETRWDPPEAAPAVPLGPKRLQKKEEHGRREREQRPKERERGREMRDEERRLQQERELRQNQLQQREQEIRAMIEKAQEEAQRKQEEEEQRKREKREKLKAKLGHHKLDLLLLTKVDKSSKPKKSSSDKLISKLKKPDQKPSLVKSKPSSSKTPVQKWCLLLAKYVPNMIRKFEGEIGYDNIKGCSRDLVHILAEKEMKKNESGEIPNELDDKRLKKIKVFAREYMDHFLQKYRKKHANKRSSNGDADTAEPATKRVRTE